MLQRTIGLFVPYHAAGLLPTLGCADPQACLAGEDIIARVENRVRGYRPAKSRDGL
jgi:hypothetical protein